MERNSKEWNSFVDKQKETIIKRLLKYKNVDTASNSLIETGNLSPYQYYKSSTVSKYLLRALSKIEGGTYGICDVCQKEIPKERLDVVPGALSCVECDKLKE
ncbi:MAG: TraR/DksA C4-type zinc finger protein [Flavobacteriaceae bacterium]|nr:TraR/DksA C4-type zinc finger protein [Flavobacteriaceae bacterium]